MSFNDNDFVSPNDDGGNSSPRGKAQSRKNQSGQTRVNEDGVEDQKAGVLVSPVARRPVRELAHHDPENFDPTVVFAIPFDVTGHWQSCWGAFGPPRCLPGLGFFGS